jgi:hypothetical protein
MTVMHTTRPKSLGKVCKGVNVKLSDLPALSNRRGWTQNGRVLPKAHSNHGGHRLYHFWETRFIIVGSVMEIDMGQKVNGLKLGELDVEFD